MPLTEEGMDTDLVKLAQHGDKGAFTSPRRGSCRSVPCHVAQDSARLQPCRGRDAAGTADHLAGPSTAPRPGALRCLVVPPPRSRLLRGGQRTRRWTPNIHLLPADEPMAADGLARSSIATSSSAASAGSPSTIERWWSCTTTWTCRSTRLPNRSASPPGRSHLDFITRCAGCARRSTPTHARRRGRLRNEHRSRRHPASFGRGCTRTPTRTPTASSTSSSMRSTRPHSAAPPGGRCGGSRP